ncbi:MAG: phosphonate C-P lyase system protein PhnG [Rhodospirillales bacterium]|nr:phosphonate C-P lyase system protein PhnG [Rhodospirillales bacterium]
MPEPSPASSASANSGPADPALTPEQAARRHWMAVLARADAASLRAALDAHAGVPAWTRLRGPESGMTMLRARQGGGGSPFNLGEAAICRCTIRLATGRLGHAYVLGRDGAHAELAAVFDALLQEADHAAPLQAAVIAPLAAAQAAQRAATARRAAATRVEFFTMASMRT